jgi:1-acyl-sn-glycerol-3-phosphate acyltransferase
VWKNPFYGLVIRYADFFPISETEEMASNLAKMVKKGYSIMIFPEGTRSKDNHIQRFHRGAFFLAEKLQLDIVPVFINGFGEVLPKTSFHLHPGHMSLEVMERIKREHLTNDDNYRIVTKHLHQIYVDKHEKMCNNR